VYFAHFSSRLQERGVVSVRDGRGSDQLVEQQHVSLCAHVMPQQRHSRQLPAAVEWV
jgi:hypothetical protein